MLRDFKRDHSLFRTRSANWIHNAQLIKSGSTALVLDVDLTTLSATYANAGDCRLVLCHEDTIILQTEDLNSGTPSERERLVREHPNEDQMFVGGRLFGRLMSTRGEESSITLTTIPAKLIIQGSGMDITSSPMAS